MYVETLRDLPTKEREFCEIVARSRAGLQVASDVAHELRKPPKERDFTRPHLATWMPIIRQAASACKYPL